MAKAKRLGRDPFEDMELPPEPTEADYEALHMAQGSVPLGSLKGKGVWLLYSRDVELAVEMASAIGATHLLYKTGHRGMFFVETARRVCDRVRRAGLVPLAWAFFCGDDPIAEAEVAVKSLQVGYEGVVFDVEGQAKGRKVEAAATGQHLLQAGLDPASLYYTSFPNIWQHLDIPYKEMNSFCRGGFMPQCYPTFRRTPRTVVNKWCYGEHTRWSKEWGNMPPVYPILAAYKDEQGVQRLSRREFLEWATTLADHAPPFFSIYRAGVTDRELWPVLAALGEAPPAPAPRPTPTEAEPEPVPPSEETPLPRPGPEEASPGPAPLYHIVDVNDTVWGICEQYTITRDQFWEWNGHLWDKQWLPRDSAYLQEGWKVQVGWQPPSGP